MVTGTSSADPSSSTSTGQNVVIGGLIVQIVFFGFFLISAFIFQQRMGSHSGARAVADEYPWRKHMWALYSSSILILIRSIVRVVEYVQGPIPDDVSAMLQQLREANEACGARDPNHALQVYEGSISNLEEMLSWCYSGMRSTTIVGRWAIRLHPRFMELLLERDPFALVLLAQYGVLLHYSKDGWCFGEWCVRVSKAVWAILDDQWRPLIEWAMKEILGVNFLEQVDH